MLEDNDGDLTSPKNIGITNVQEGYDQTPISISEWRVSDDEEVGPDHKKMTFFWLIKKGAKFWINALSPISKTFRKIWCETAQKKVIRVQSLVSVIFAGEIGPRSLCRPKNTRRSRNEGTGMVAIESQHENRSDRMFSGICEPQYNEL